LPLQPHTPNYSCPDEFATSQPIKKTPAEIPKNERFLLEFSYIVSRNVTKLREIRFVSRSQVLYVRQFCFKLLNQPLHNALARKEAQIIWSGELPIKRTVLWCPALQFFRAIAQTVRKQPHLLELLCSPLARVTARDNQKYEPGSFN
jgi:hypothetical protein